MVSAVETHRVRVRVRVNPQSTLALFFPLYALVCLRTLQTSDFFLHLLLPFVKYIIVVLNGEYIIIMIIIVSNYDGKSQSDG